VGVRARFVASVIRFCLSPLTLSPAVVIISDPNVVSAIKNYQKLERSYDINMARLQKIIFALFAWLTRSRSKAKATPETEAGCLTITTKQKVFEAGCATSVTGRWAASMTTSKY
tara:strand:- start:3547 stop:3888 length:342 start_codon:yes stop_codon:yes gene_type:complete